jgi:DNA-binding Lrp family transcriptional regulator
MKELKSIDYKILFELMKDARRSDRELAKIVGVSQPTITRRRASLERDIIDGYTTIPKWDKLGYEIFAITFVKSKIRSAPIEEKETAIKKCSEWVMSKPNVVLASAGRGCGFDAFLESFHRNYTDYMDFLRELRANVGNVVDTDSFIVPLTGTHVIKPFHLKYLGEKKVE